MVTSSTLCLQGIGRADDGYDVRVVSRNGEPATAGIDLALALVEDDYGTEVAQTVARWLVLYLRRPGGQTQFAAPVWMPRARRAPIRDVQEAIDAEPAGAHSIPELARRASMSPRHFTRVFTDEVGEAPGAYVERVRTEVARRQLEETDDTVTVIAARCGCPDLRGAGWGSAPMDRLGVGPVRLVAHDWGGPVAFIVMLRYPQKVTGFFGVNTIAP